MTPKWQLITYEETDSVTSLSHNMTF